jgi:hypothetical protein
VVIPESDHCSPCGVVRYTFVQAFVYCYLVIHSFAKDFSLLADEIDVLRPRSIKITLCYECFQFRGVHYVFQAPSTAAAASICAPEK